MLSIRRALLAIAFLISAATLLVAQFPMPTSRPPEDTQPAQVREIVSKYCRLDYEAARLDPQAWPKYQPLVWWKSSPDYTQIDVIARYTVDPEPVLVHGKFRATVHYRLLGIYDLANGYVREPDGATQDVDFTVSSENTEWRIADAENTAPHPSRAAMLKWLNAKIGATEDPAAKTRLQEGLNQLQAQSASPFAK